MPRGDHPGQHDVRVSPRPAHAGHVAGRPGRGRPLYQPSLPGSAGGDSALRTRAGRRGYGPPQFADRDRKVAGRPSQRRSGLHIRPSSDGPGARGPVNGPERSREPGGRRPRPEDQPGPALGGGRSLRGLRPGRLGPRIGHRLRARAQPGRRRCRGSSRKRSQRALWGPRQARASTGGRRSRPRPFEGGSPTRWPG